MGAKKLENIRLLLVDDDKDLLDILAFSFKRFGYQVFLASNGCEAFDLVQTNPVDVIVSDICMPGGDGIQLLDRIKAQMPETPIILLVTGYADIKTEDAHDKGAEALFAKPFDKKEVHEAITRLMTPVNERWSLAQNLNSNNVDADLQVELQFPGLPAALEARVLNLGRGGMFITLPEGHYPNVNDIISFKVAFAEKNYFLLGSGVVRWVRTKGVDDSPVGCGIEFTYLDEDGRNQILEYVNSKKPKAYIPKN